MINIPEQFYGFSVVAITQDRECYTGILQADDAFRIKVGQTILSLEYVTRVEALDSDICIVREPEQKHQYGDKFHTYLAARWRCAAIESSIQNIKINNFYNKCLKMFWDKYVSVNRLWRIAT